MTEADLDTLFRHAEYGHLEGQDYDLIVRLVAEVRRLRDGIAVQRYAALSETIDCHDCCTGCPMEPEDYPDWLTATWALIGDDDD